MSPDTKIYVAGHRGLAGSALVRELKKRGYSNLVLRTHAELELTDRAAVRSFFEKERPDHVYLAAARVGGILANLEYPAEFIHQNLAIQNNVIDESWRVEVKRLLFLGSACIYPRECPQPIKEEYLLSGPLEFTNRAYALAKIAGVEMCWSYNRQYGTRFLAAMPNNLYGIGDNYDLQQSHLLPAFIRRLHEAKVNGARAVTMWGTGTVRRELLYGDDNSEACVTLMELPDTDFDKLLSPHPSSLIPHPAGPQAPLINIGWGEDYTIKEIALLARDVIGFKGAIEWDPTKPDGTPRKLLDVGRMKALGWAPRTPLDVGIGKAYQDFLSRFADAGKTATASRV